MLPFFDTPIMDLSNPNGPEADDDTSAVAKSIAKTTFAIAVRPKEVRNGSDDLGNGTDYRMLKGKKNSANLNKTTCS